MLLLIGVCFTLGGCGKNAQSKSELVVDDGPIEENEIENALAIEDEEDIEAEQEEEEHVPSKEELYNTVWEGSDSDGSYCLKFYRDDYCKLFNGKKWLECDWNIVSDVLILNYDGERMPFYISYVPTRDMLTLTFDDNKGEWYRVDYLNDVADDYWVSYEEFTKNVDMDELLAFATDYAENFHDELREENSTGFDGKPLDRYPSPIKYVGGYYLAGVKYRSSDWSNGTYSSEIYNGEEIPRGGWNTINFDLIDGVNQIGYCFTYSNCYGDDYVLYVYANDISFDENGKCSINFKDSSVRISSGELTGYLTDEALDFYRWYTGVEPRLSAYPYVLRQQENEEPLEYTINNLSNDQEYDFETKFNSAVSESVASINECIEKGQSKVFTN